MVAPGLALHSRAGGDLRRSRARLTQRALRFAIRKVPVRPGHEPGFLVAAEPPLIVSHDSSIIPQLPLFLGLLPLAELAQASQRGTPSGLSENQPVTLGNVRKTR